MCDLLFSLRVPCHCSRFTLLYSISSSLPVFLIAGVAVGVSVVFVAARLASPFKYEFYCMQIYDLDSTGFIVDIGKTLPLFMELQTLDVVLDICRVTSMARETEGRKRKKKQETRTRNAQLHATISVAAVASAVAAIAAAMATSSAPSKDERMAKTDMAVTSAATLVTTQCVEAAEAMGA
ncbi:hypothetical protein HN51_065633 [Arachis hypogaea]